MGSKEVGRGELDPLPVRIGLTVGDFGRRDREEGAITLPFEHERRLALLALIENVPPAGLGKRGSRLT